MGVLIRRGGLLAALLALALAGGLAACAHSDDEDPRTEPPARSSDASADRDDDSDDDDDRDDDDAEPAKRDKPPERVVSTDTANADDPGAGRPARRASDGVVEEGKGYLIAGNAGEAARRFERATRIDPSNGFAWYHLGRARIALGDTAGAIGVLEKAESLLGPYPSARAETRRLLDRLQ